ncbi:hypothetical protein CRN48_04355 [Vibrio vulnificus]|nr:hypothetical protein CRN39_20960 [Vibrio vulnificus]POC48874.1 hypothetical protein CRN48_04355 [Vibrio vulnificus]
MIFSTFKFAKETDFELPRRTKETIFHRETIRDKEAAPMKLLTTLEAVNDVGNAITAHLVPPERT